MLIWLTLNYLNYPAASLLEMPYNGVYSTYLVLGFGVGFGIGLAEHRDKRSTHRTMHPASEIKSLCL